MPFVLWATATMNPELCPSTSLELLKIAFHFIKQMNMWLSIPEKNYNSETKQVNRNKPKYLTVVTTTVMTRIITTLFTLINTMESVLAAYDCIDVKLPPYIYDLFKKIEDFGTERLGTHPLEDLNGFIRESSRSYDSILNACNT